MSDQIHVFVIYAREDREVKQGLLRHLNPLKDQYNLSVWHDDYIEPGQEWKPSIESRLAQTDLFLLLVSADFMNSEFIHQVEFKFALDRHKQGKSIVIPVIIDYCLWDVDIRYRDSTFNLKDLQVLPDEAKPIGEWKTSEQAYHNIANGIRRVLSTIKENRRQAITVNKSTNQGNESVEESAKQDEQTTVTEEKLHTPFIVQIAKEEPDKNHTISTHETVNKARGNKRVMYALLIVLAVSTISFLIFRKPETHLLRTADTPATSSRANKDTAIPVDTSSHDINNAHKEDSKTPGDRSNSSGTKSSVNKVVINSFNTFPEALAAVFRDAPQYFVNLKGNQIGTAQGMKKFKTRLVLRDKTFRPSYLLENKTESQFTFVNENAGGYESIKSAVVSLLKSKGIKFDYEPSASIGYEKYAWNNETFEIMLLTRKYTDNFLEITFFHRRK